MLPTCSTDFAVVVCAVADAHGVLRVPQSADPGVTPGIRFSVKPLVPINIQLVEAIGSALHKDVGLHLHIEQEYHDLVPDGNGGEATLYVARLDASAGLVAQTQWASIPDLLRQLTGRARIPYLRAWQVLAGGLQLNTKAVEAAAVAKYLANDP